MTATAVLRASSPVRSFRRITSDSLYRNSLLLIVNSAVLAGFGLAFWTIASRMFDAKTVGATAVLIGVTTFVSTAVSLGLPNLVLRFLATERDQRRLVVACCALVTAFGTAVGVGLWLVPGHLGIPLDSLAGSRLLLPVLVLAVVVPAVSNIADSAIVARRESQYVLFKNVVGSGSKLLALPLAAAAGTSGLFSAYLFSAIVATVAAFVVLHRRWTSERPRLRDVGAEPTNSPLLASLTGRARFALGNHVGVVVAILPVSTLPLIVLSRLGARSAAYVAMPMMMIALLNVIPSMTAQSLFAEIASGDGHEREHVRKALVAIYSLAVPLIALVVVAAPMILSVFGADYREAGTPVLRCLALASVFACFNYVADTMLIARSQVAGYTVLNVGGTVCAMAFPMIGLTYGLTGFGLGWLVGQVGYALLALATLAFYRRRAAHDRVMTMKEAA